MASKILSLLIFFIFLSLLSDANSVNTDLNREHNAFRFLRGLIGAKKGETRSCIDNLKSYMLHFGYLNYSSFNTNNYFDDALESAVKIYQLYFHLDMTGALDPQTVSTMTIPRCGVADHIDGVQVDTFYKNKVDASLDRKMTYAFRPDTDPNFKQPISKAFNRWADFAKLTFTGAEEIEDFNNADVRIAFYHRNDSDYQPIFDGKNGILANLTVPPLGTLVFDKAELWSTNGAQPGAVDLYTVALHEIGHFLGLKHSVIKHSIMHPLLPYGVAKDIGSEDILEIKNLHNI